MSRPITGVISMPMLTKLAGRDCRANLERMSHKNHHVGESAYMRQVQGTAAPNTILYVEVHTKSTVRLGVSSSKIKLHQTETSPSIISALTHKHNEQEDAQSFRYNERFDKQQKNPEKISHTIQKSTYMRATRGINPKVLWYTLSTKGLTAPIRFKYLLSTVARAQRIPPTKA